MWYTFCIFVIKNCMTFIEQKFNIPTLDGISEKSVTEHLKLYAGYVKHANLIIEKIKSMNPETDSYAMSEMQRRFAFEYDGMRNHELYFSQFEGGVNDTTSLVELRAALEKSWGTFDAWFTSFNSLAMTRGVGWAILYFDKKTNSLVQTWIEEQHIGHLAGLNIILALDMWEHSYMLDYVPSEKKKYIDAFFKNLNWDVVEKRFREAVSQ